MKMHDIPRKVYLHTLGQHKSKIPNIREDVIQMALANMIADWAGASHERDGNIPYGMPNGSMDGDLRQFLLDNVKL